MVSRHAAVAELPREDVSRLSSSCGAYLSYERLVSLDRDARWSGRHVAVSEAGKLLALLPCYRPAKGAWLNPAYDLRRLAAGSDLEPEQEERWLYVGGRADLSAGLLRLPALDRSALEAVADAAGEAAREQAASEGRGVCALYVNVWERPSLERAVGSGRVEWEVATEARLAVAGEQDYLRSLKSSHRSVVRRDWAERDALGLRAEAAEWDDVAEPAYELVAAVARANGLPDDPRLVRMRLDVWRRDPEIERVAFVVRAGGRVLAVSLAWVAGDLLQVHDVGLVPRDEAGAERRVAYVEAMVYAPLRFAAERGCTTVTLATESSETKRLRGAVLRPLVALARPRQAARPVREGVAASLA